MRCSIQQYTTCGCRERPGCGRLVGCWCPLAMGPEMRSDEAPRKQWLEGGGAGAAGWGGVGAEAVQRLQRPDRGQRLGALEEPGEAAVEDRVRDQYAGQPVQRAAGGG